MTYEVANIGISWFPFVFTVALPILGFTFLGWLLFRKESTEAFVGFSIVMSAVGIIISSGFTYSELDTNRSHTVSDKFHEKYGITIVDSDRGSMRPNNWIQYADKDGKLKKGYLIESEDDKELVLMERDK